MKFQGSHSFDVPSQKVFHSLLDPAILQVSIPGCVGAWYPDETYMKVRLKLPLSLPGLEGPYDVSVRVKEQQSPHILVLQAGRRGHIGGTVETTTHIALTDDEQGEKSVLTYETEARLKGPIAAADNPLIREVIVHGLNTFFKNLNVTLSKTV